MDELINKINNYSTKKLKEIVEHQHNAYNPISINLIKDELIRRGEEFQYDEERISDVQMLNDDELKSIVEREHDSYHLEDMEIARKEYLRRGFKNEYEETNENEGQFEKRYKNLRTIVAVIAFIAWAMLILTIVSAYLIFDSLRGTEGSLNFVSLMALIPGVISFIVLLSFSELIKVFLDIEENTRKHSSYYGDTAIER